jgi:hemerythrin superfamily protein
MDAIALLKGDHRTVESLFKRFEEASARSFKLKRRLVDQVIRELSVHAVIEEQFFYPALRERSKKHTGEVLDALEEHHVAKWLLKELEDTPAEHERFDAKMHVLMENVRQHIKEEERLLFAHARKALSAAELRALGQTLATARKAAPTHPHPRAPDTPPANLVAGTVSAVLDMGRDALQALRHRAPRVPVPGKRAAHRREGNGWAEDMEAQAPA